MRPLVLALTAFFLACSPGRGATCSETVLCSEPYVCVTTGALRRCLLPCDRDVGRTDTGATIQEGDLCSDGSVCRASDAGLVCYFAGSIPLGEACPATSCDPMMRVCDCEPGTLCHEGFCRQTCNIAMQDVGTDAPAMDDAPADDAPAMDDAPADDAPADDAPADDAPTDDAGQTILDAGADFDGGVDGGSPYDRVCGVHAICTAGVCLPIDAGL